MVSEAASISHHKAWLPNQVKHRRRKEVVDAVLDAALEIVIHNPFEPNQKTSNNSVTSKSCCFNPTYGAKEKNAMNLVSRCHVRIKIKTISS